MQSLQGFCHDSHILTSANNILCGTSDPVGIYILFLGEINFNTRYLCLFSLVYTDRMSDIISIVSVVPPARSFIISDAAAIKHIAQDRQTFVKPLEIYQALALFGPNVGIVEGRDWYRHKKIIMASRFNEVCIFKICKFLDILIIRLRFSLLDNYIDMLE